MRFLVIGVGLSLLFGCESKLPDRWKGEHTLTIKNASTVPLCTLRISDRKQKFTVDVMRDNDWNWLAEEGSRKVINYDNPTPIKPGESRSFPLGPRSMSLSVSSCIVEQHFYWFKVGTNVDLTGSTTIFVGGAGGSVPAAEGGAIVVDLDTKVDRRVEAAGQAAARQADADRWAQQQQQKQQQQQRSTPAVASKPAEPKCIKQGGVCGADPCCENDTSHGCHSDGKGGLRCMTNAAADRIRFGK